MLHLRKLKKLFGRDSTAHIHPRKRDGELVVCNRMEKILRERNVTSKPFHVKVCVLSYREFFKLHCIVYRSH